MKNQTSDKLPKFIKSNCLNAVYCLSNWVHFEGNWYVWLKSKRGVTNVLPYEGYSIILGVPRQYQTGPFAKHRYGFHHGGLIRDMAASANQM